MLWLPQQYSRQFQTNNNIKEERQRRANNKKDGDVSEEKRRQTNHHHHHYHHQCPFIAWQIVHILNDFMFFLFYEYLLIKLSIIKANE